MDCRLGETINLMRQRRFGQKGSALPLVVGMILAGVVYSIAPVWIGTNDLTRSGYLKTLG